MRSFSVLISVYHKDSPLYLEEALESVINNSEVPSEIVLIKDGKLTNELEKVIDKYQKEYNIFKIIQNENNIGLGLSLAKGLPECKYEYIARMDSDDICKHDRFERQLNEIERGYDIVSCWSEFFENNTNNVIAVKKRPEMHADIVKLSKRRSPVSHAASMYRKSSVLKAGNYKHCLYYEDYYLWLRMIKSGAVFYNIQDYIYCIRASNDQFGRRGGWKYLKLELGHLFLFYKEGYHSLYDYIINSITRIFSRLLPLKIRRFLYLSMWKIFN